MSKRNSRLVYIDGFAGPGVYAGGEPGSPIIALRARLEHVARDRMTNEMIYCFIEEDGKRVARLREEVDKLGPLPKNIVVDIKHGAYEDIFGGMLDDVQTRGVELAPTFAFIDPFGYAAASMKLSGRFLQFQRCEVLIYVPFPFITRFVSEAAVEPALTTLFGTDEWKGARERSGPDRLRCLHDLFQQRLQQDCGLDYVRSFQIVKTGSNTGYHLFFGTKHKRGLERMKGVMWKVDPGGGQRFTDATNAAQMTLFQAKPDLAQLRSAMLARFKDAPCTIGEIEDFTLIETAYLPSPHVRAVLKPMETEGRLKIVQAKGDRRRGTYPPGTRVRFVW
jgi:three-Cys-motif partner protein